MSHCNKIQYERTGSVTYMRQSRLKMSATFCFQCKKYNDIGTSWENLLKGECINFSRLDVADQLSFLFDNLDRSLAEYTPTVLVGGSHVIQIYSGITRGRVLNGELSYREILEVKLFAFA